MTLRGQSDQPETVDRVEVVHARPPTRVLLHTLTRKIEEVVHDALETSAFQEAASQF